MKFLLCMLCGSMAWAQSPMKWQLPLENNKANELYDKQKFDEARQVYEHMLEKEPENGALAYNLGNVYNALGDPEKATEMYQKALKSDNLEAANHSRYNMGTLDLQSKKPQDAIKNLSQYLRKTPNDLDAKRNLELALRMLEQQKQDQNKDKQDQQQDQKQDQQQEQQSQGQKSEDDKNKQQQGQQQQEQDQQDQQQQQDQKDQQDKQDQKQNQGKQDDAQDQKERQEQQQKNEQEKLNDQVKQQILDALDDQELRQQKQYQQRKIGTVRRRAKDW